MKALSFCVALLLFVIGCSGSASTATSQTPADGDDWITLFDGTSLDGWTMAGPGSFTIQNDGSMLSDGGMGLFYYAERPFRDFILEMEWKAVSDSANSGIFLRFPEQSDDPWYAVNNGYEIQIDDSRDPMHRTGSIYSFASSFKSASKPAGEWNQYRIEVTGQRYQIYLNGEKVNDFMGERGREGYIGVQNHDPISQVWYRNIRVKPLPDAAYPETLADLLAVEEQREPIRALVVTATNGYRHASIETIKEVLPSLNATTEFEFTITENLDDLNPANLTGYNLLIFANSTLRMEGAPEPWRTYEVTLASPRGEQKGVVELVGTPDNLSGTMEFENSTDGEVTLEDVTLEGNQLSFVYPDPDGPGTEVTATLEGTTWKSSVMMNGNAIPFNGVMTSGNVGAWRLYNVSMNTPQGPMNGQLTLTGTPDDLEGTLGFQGMPASALQDVTLEGDELAFSFDAGQYGIIAVTGTATEESFDGTMSVGGNQIPLTGEADADGGAGGGSNYTGQLVNTSHQEAILGFLRAGKGIAAAHAGLDALYAWDAYREIMGGGLFEEHPWTQSVRVLVEDATNPAMQHLGDSFWIRDEIYVLDENPRWNSHVLASLDMQSVGIEQGPADGTANDYPISWIREQDGGRIFVTKLGHFDDVWRTPDFLQHFLQGLRMAAGRLPADFSGHRVKEVISEGVWPDDIAVDERGNVWIAELTGKVHHYDAATGETHLIAEVPTTDPVNIEHGLYGIEVDPNFYDGEPYVYLYYAEQETFINTLYRYEYRDGMLDMATEKVLLRVPTEPQCCHQAGDLEWGPDGTLYLSTGDTGMSEVRPDWEISEERIAAFKERHNLKDIHWSRLVDSERSAQNLTDLRGKILRINKDGTIPKDNPFFGQPGVRWEIYAYGLRNPYRFKVDPQTGALYIAVVGPDASFDYDEYNISVNGGENFGWPRTLGKLFYNHITPDLIPNFVPPMWEYTYESGGRSATVGPIYRSDGEHAFPEIFQNKLFLFDWSRRWIKWADMEEGTFTSDMENDVRVNPPRIELPATRLVNIKTFDQLTNTAPISIEMGPDGSIYVAEFTGFWGPAPNSKVTRYRWVKNASQPSSQGTSGEASSSQGDDR